MADSSGCPVINAVKASYNFLVADPKLVQRALNLSIESRCMHMNLLNKWIKDARHPHGPLVKQHPAPNLTAWDLIKKFFAHPNPSTTVVEGLTLTRDLPPTDIPTESVWHLRATPVSTSLWNFNVAPKAVTTSSPNPATAIAVFTTMVATNMASAPSSSIEDAQAASVATVYKTMTWLWILIAMITIFDCILFALMKRKEAASKALARRVRSVLTTGKTVAGDCPVVYRVHHGNKYSFHFDKKLGRWVDFTATAEAKVTQRPAPVTSIADTEGRPCAEDAEKQQIQGEVENFEHGSPSPHTDAQREPTEHKAFSDAEDSSRYEGELKRWMNESAGPDAAASAPASATIPPLSQGDSVDSLSNLNIVVSIQDEGEYELVDVEEEDDCYVAPASDHMFRMM